MEKISALGLDIGRRRIGVAGCDGTGLIATGLMTIERTSFQQTIAQLQKLIEEREVQILVVGLPYSLNGSIGFQALEVQKFAQKLAKTLQLPIEYVDERLTSVEAQEQLVRKKSLPNKARDRFSSQAKGTIDRVAAAIILQQWLDAKRLAAKSLCQNPQFIVENR